MSSIWSSALVSGGGLGMRLCLTFQFTYNSYILWWWLGWREVGVALQARPDHPSNPTTISIISCSWSCRWWAQGKYNISHTPSPKSGLLGKYQEMILNVTAGAVWGVVKKRYPPHNLPSSPQQSHAKLSNLHTHTQILYKHNPTTTTNSNCCK